jgi:hypothetical protein
MHDKPPLNDKHRMLAIKHTAELIRDGLDKITAELLIHPVICVIRWIDHSKQITDGYRYEIFDLNDNDDLPAVTGTSHDISEILGVAEDYKALVIFYNKPLTRKIHLSTMPVALLDDDDYKELNN